MEVGFSFDVIFYVLPVSLMASVPSPSDTFSHRLSTLAFAIRYGFGCIGSVTFEILWSQGRANTPKEDYNLTLRYVWCRLIRSNTTPDPSDIGSFFMSGYLRYRTQIVKLDYTIHYANHQL